MSRVLLRVYGDISALGDEVSRAALKALPASPVKGGSEKNLALALRKELGESLRKLLVSRELCDTLSHCSEELDPLGGGGEKLKGNGVRVLTVSGPVVLQKAILSLSPIALQKVILSLSRVAYRTMARLVKKEVVDDIRYVEIVDAIEAELTRHRCAEKIRSHVK